MGDMIVVHVRGVSGEEKVDERIENQVGNRGER